MKCPPSCIDCGVVWSSPVGECIALEAVVLLRQLPLLSEVVCLPDCEIAMSLQALRLPHAHPSDDEDTVPASTALGVLLNRHTHEKLSLARAEPPSTERHDPFLLVYPKWLESPMADCDMQAALVLDGPVEMARPCLPSKPCTMHLHF